VSDKPQIELVPRRRAAVAIVGRPNVGKSTLFNRLVGRRQAIVHNLPGVTRDRIFGTTEIGDVEADVIDTGGLVPRDDALGLNAQVLLAVEESDLLLLVLDGGSGLVPADEEVLAALRRYGKPTLAVVNKSDLSVAEDHLSDFFALGCGEPLLVSAEHGRGLAELFEAMQDALPVAEAESDSEGAAAVAIVGRPNVGKSSLLNRLIGGERALVSPLAGTTRDPVDTRVRWGEQELVLIDTAGIRRRSQVSGAAEGLAVMMARRQIERCRVALLVLDASHGLTSGDLAIAGLIWDLGRGCVAVFNKWDLLVEESRQALEEGWERLSEVMAAPARVNISALTGRGVNKIVPLVTTALRDHASEVSTSRLNEIVRRAVERHHVPRKRGVAWKFFYVTQVSTCPPTFMLFANRNLTHSSSLRRYLENSLRRELDLPGVPLRLVVRKRSAVR
jgi:GTP-binding protein